MTSKTHFGVAQTLNNPGIHWEQWLWHDNRFMQLTGWQSGDMCGVSCRLLWTPKWHGSDEIINIVSRCGLVLNHSSCTLKCWQADVTSYAWWNSLQKLTFFSRFSSKYRNSPSFFPLMPQRIIKYNRTVTAWGFYVLLYNLSSFFEHPPHWCPDHLTAVSHKDFIVDKNKQFPCGWLGFFICREPSALRRHLGNCFHTRQSGSKHLSKHFCGFFYLSWSKMLQKRLF